MFPRSIRSPAIYQRAKGAFTVNGKASAYISLVTQCRSRLNSVDNTFAFRSPARLLSFKLSIVLIDGEST